MAVYYKTAHEKAEEERYPDDSTVCGGVVTTFHIWTGI